ncbi:hypothetical protein BDV96DRAFT_611982 [Lophiotrema nucula]|uniref:Integral membrane protein-like protein n=1 Tax=Lophiotrema nucula TaxID=690887 RepID=A0A6A5ZCY6_9PLEO|nr:hypothetical protein BDV96DRAFT_611982 [Lophiotrema nucula]
MSMVSQTLQGATLSSISNVIAQGISAYKDNVPFSLHVAPILKFAIFSIISNPPNIIWQNFLEDLFPTNVAIARPPSEKANGKPKSSASPRTRKSTQNILIKFMLDQTFGAVLNTLMFLAFIGYVNAPAGGKASAWDNVALETREKFWPMIYDGWKLWPAFSLISFLWIPVDKRIVAGCLVGMGWNIYLSLLVDA